MAARSKKRGFSLRDRRSESSGKRIHFRRITRKRPTKSLIIMVIMAILILALILILRGIPG